MQPGRVVANNADATYTTPAKTTPAPVAAGPTSFWSRLQQSGRGQTVLAQAEKAGGAVGRFLFGNTAKFLNQGYQEGKQVVDTAKMVTAAQTKNTQAFQNAQQQSQKDYQGFKTSGGLLNKGTFTDQQEAQQGSAAGVKKIAGGTLATAAEVVPLGKVARAGESGYTVGKGVVAAEDLSKTAPKGVAALKAAAKGIGTQAAVGAGAGAAGTAGSELANGQKLNAKEILKGTAAGAVIGGGTHAVGEVFKAGSSKFLDHVKGTTAAKDAANVTDDVMTSDAADKAAAAAHTKVGVADTDTGSTNVSVKTPVRPGVSVDNTTHQINVRTPQRMTDEQFGKEFDTLQKNYQKEVNAVSKDVGKNVSTDTENKLLPSRDINHDITPETPQSKIAKAANPDLETIDGYHHSSELVNDHVDMMRQIDDTARGGTKQKTEDGYIRTSEHSPFYRNYFTENGRAPTKTAYVENAKAELASGKAPYGMSDTYKQLIARESGLKYNPKIDSTAAAGVVDHSLTTRQHVAIRAIDAKYEKALADLHDRYENPSLTAPKAPKVLSRETIKPTRQTGGSPRQTRTLNTQKNTLNRATRTDIPKNRVTQSNTPGESRVSGSARNMESRAVEHKLTEGYSDLPEYRTINMKDQASKATDLINTDKEKAIRIATGKENAPGDLHSLSVLKTLEHQAVKDGDADLMLRLSQSPLHGDVSRAGQSLRVMAERDPYSPVSAIKTVRDAREAAAKRISKDVSGQIGKTVKDIDSKIKAPSKSEWQMFVESIKC